MEVGVVSRDAPLPYGGEIGVVFAKSKLLSSRCTFLYDTIAVSHVRYVFLLVISGKLPFSLTAN